MPSERAWMAWAGPDPREGAVAVFASSRREAKRLAWPFVWDWADGDYTQLRVRLLKGDCAHHRLRPGPHVNDSPECCEACELWHAEERIDGLCDGCHEEREWNREEEALEAAGQHTLTPEDER